MDPNLTLAHITNNTAVIQLHQVIAYPNDRLKACPISLPSASSSETCITAAAEISTIAQQYLSMSAGITNSQFPFYLFIAARVLLTHSIYDQVSLHSAFEDLLSSLIEIACRWTGNKNTASVEETDSPVKHFVHKLRRARENATGQRPSNEQAILDIRQPVYSGDDEGQETLPGVSSIDTFAAPNGDFTMPIASAETSPNSSLAHQQSTYDDIAEYRARMSYGGFDTNTGAEGFNEFSSGLGSYAATFEEGDLSSLTGLFDQPFQEVRKSAIGLYISLFLIIVSQMLRVSTYGGTQGFTYSL